MKTDLKALNDRLLEIDNLLESLNNEREDIKILMINDKLELENYMIQPANKYNLNAEHMDEVSPEQFDKYFKRIPETVKVKTGKHSDIMKKFPNILTIVGTIHKLIKKKK